MPARNTGFLRWYINEAQLPTEMCAVLTASMANHSLHVLDSSISGIGDALCTGWPLSNYVCEYGLFIYALFSSLISADARRFFHKKYIDKRLNAMFMTHTYTISNNEYDQPFECAAYCGLVTLSLNLSHPTFPHSQVAPCRSYAINKGMMSCELYMVDDTYSMFSTTWLYAATGWITYVADEVNY